MIRAALAALIIAVLAGLAYLLLWPVPIDPVAWQPPEDQGYTGVHAPNTELAGLTRLPMGAHGPEDVAELDGALYTSSQTGQILRRDPTSGEVTTFADTGGIPLGIEFDREGHLLVADAAKGLLRVAPDGTVTTLLSVANGVPIRYADDVDQGPDGTICLSDASTKFGAVESGSTLAGSLLELMEHGRTGRIICTDAQGQNPYILIDNLSFPNGVAFTPEGDLLVNVTGTYETLRVAPDGTVSQFAGNYPGFPDNINPGPDLDGQPTYLVGLVSPRSSELDAMAGKPFLRKIVQRLPESLRPAPQEYAHLLVLAHDGDVLASWQDPQGAYHSVTGGLVHDGTLYLSSLLEDALGSRPAPELLRPERITP